MTDRLLELIDAIDNQIAEYEQQISDLKERKEYLEQKLQALNDEQQRGDTIDYQKMKL